MNIGNTNTLLPFVQDTVRQVMQRPHDRVWTIQGLGMLRTNFDAAKKHRLHIWSRQFMTPGVSTIHSHPWDFTSHVVAGTFTNVRLFETDVHLDAPATHHSQYIKCGEGGGLVSESERRVRLEMQQPECYGEGDSYTQTAEEIHASYFSDGSVTLCERTVRSGDGDHARVFWKIGDDFVTAEPRAATAEEIEAAVAFSLKLWF